MGGGRYIVRTLGCKANLFDTQLLEAELQRRGWHAAAEADGVDLCIVNTCTVTDEADRQSRKTAEKLGRRYPGARVVVTGCLPEADPEQAAAWQVHYLAGNRDKPRLVDLIEDALAAPAPTSPAVLGSVEGYESLRSRHPEDREWPLPEAPVDAPLRLEGQDRPARTSARTRAFLKVQEGCDAFCTFCVIPYARGPARSLRPREIVARVQGLVDQGVREVVLTGTNLGDYGRDWGPDPDLDALVDAVLDHTGLQRLRLSSLAPDELTPRLYARLADDPRLCPHVHVSLQSPHSQVLKGMKRRYREPAVREALTRLAAIARPPTGVFVGMDVIAGFPGEDEAAFSASVETLAALPWTRLHVFPYSERAGTPATRLPGAVPPEERRRRARVLAELSLARVTAHAHRALEATRLEGVLVEGPARGPDGTRAWVSGYTPGYLRVLLPAGPGLEPNQLVAARPRSVVTDPASGDATVVAEPAPPPGASPRSPSPQPLGGAVD